MDHLIWDLLVPIAVSALTGGFSARIVARRYLRAGRDVVANSPSGQYATGGHLSPTSGGQVGGRRTGATVTSSGDGSMAIGRDYNQNEPRRPKRSK